MSSRVERDMEIQGIEASERHREHRKEQPATPTRTVTGDEWNVRNICFHAFEEGRLTASEYARIDSLLDDLGDAEWRVRRHRDEILHMYSEQLPPDGGANG